MKRVFVLLIGLCLPCAAFPQDEQGAEDPYADYRFVTNAIFQFDNRNERYYGVSARMNGLRIGIEFERVLRMGVGFYQNNAFYSFEPPSAVDSLQQSVRFGYNTFFMEWVLYRDFRWELALPMSYGSGVIELNNFSRGNSIPEFVGADTIGRNRLLDIGLSGHVKVLPWVGIGAGVGYRQLLISDRLYRRPFSTPYLNFKVKLFLGYIYKGIFKPEVVQEEREEYLRHRAEKKAKRSSSP